MENTSNNITNNSINNITPVAKKPTLPNRIIEFVKSIFRILRTILIFPGLLLDKCINGCHIKWKNLGTGAKSPREFSDLTKKLSAKNVSVIPDPTKAYEWKKELVEKAEHSLEISGYCGGKPFKEFLSIIENKLQKNPNFKVRILSNSNLVNNDEKETIQNLTKKYPNNFEFTPIEAVITLFPRLYRYENHTKMIVADQKYFVAGGTGITNRLLPIGTVKKTPGKCGFLSDGNLDIDLAGEGDVAEELKRQFDKIWIKWKSLTHKKENPKLDKGRNLSGIPINKRCHIDRFSKQCDEKQLDDCHLVISQPNQGALNLGEKTYIDLIDQAKTNIFLSNMVFNEKNIINALDRAVQRGVNVTVITNGDNKTSPVAAKFIGPRGRRFYKKLLRKRKESEGTFKIYELNKHDVLLHTKSMIVDDQNPSIKPKVLVGSFNISKESTRCDDESILVVKSKTIASKTRTFFESLIKESKQINKKSMRKFAFRTSVAKGKTLEFFMSGLQN